MKRLIYKQCYSPNTQKFQVLMNLEPCIILKLFLKLNDFELEYSCNLYSYKKGEFDNTGSQVSVTKGKKYAC